MAPLRDDESIINMALFRRFHFYQIFNPNSLKIFDFHVSRLIGVAVAAAVLCGLVFSAFSFVADTGNTVDRMDLLLIMFVYIINGISFVKTYAFLCKADVVWDLFDLTRADFLTSNRCRRNTAVLHRRRELSIKVTNYYQYYVMVVLAVWLIIPFVVNAFVTTGSPNARYQNIFNVRYPVTASVYNQYYYVFYGFESLVGLYLLYNGTLVDNFLFSMCWTIISQYEVLNLAFASIGHDDKSTSPDNGT